MESVYMNLPLLQNLHRPLIATFPQQIYCLFSDIEIFIIFGNIFIDDKNATIYLWSKLFFSLTSNQNINLHIWETIFERLNFGRGSQAADDFYGLLDISQVDRCGQ